MTTMERFERLAASPLTRHSSLRWRAHLITRMEAREAIDPTWPTTIKLARRLGVPVDAEAVAG